MTVAPYERPASALAHNNELPVAAMDSWIQVIADVAKLAQHISDTEFVPDTMRGKPAAVAAAILAGREAGIGPMASLQHIHLIKGKPGQSAQLMRQLVLAAGHELRYVDTTDTRCVVEGKRRGEDEWTRVTFTSDQARRAKIDLGGYPEDKLVARATARLCRRKFADCIGGMPYTIEELQDGDVPSDFDGAAPTVEPSKPEPATPAKANGRTAQRRTRVAAPEPEQAAAPPSVTQEAAGAPPLPGEPGYDEPPAREPSGSGPISKEQLTKLHTVLTEHGVHDRDEKLDIARRILRKPDLSSSTHLTRAEASTLIDVLEQAGQHPAGFAGFLTELLTATEAGGSEDGGG
jgi:hypothetical protein